MIRVASGPSGVLDDAKTRLSLLVPEPSGRDATLHSMVELPLVRASIPVFALLWRLLHVIDGQVRATGSTGLPRRRPAFFFLMLQSEDATLATVVRDLCAYGSGQSHFGKGYARAISMSDDGYPVLALERLGLLEPDDAEALDETSLMIDGSKSTDA